NTEKFSSRVIPDVSVKLKLQSSEPLRSIYCPTHDAEIKRRSEHEAVVGFEARNARPDSDFRLIFTRETRQVGIKLMTFKRAAANEGFFMLMASPGWGAGDADSSASARKVGNKDIVFVLDTSGSMADGGKLEQAKKALNYCLANLGTDDRFDVVRF